MEEHCEEELERKFAELAECAIIVDDGEMRFTREIASFVRKLNNDAPDKSFDMLYGEVCGRILCNGKPINECFGSRRTTYGGHEFDKAANIGFWFLHYLHNILKNGYEVIFKLSQDKRSFKEYVSFSKTDRHIKTSTITCFETDDEDAEPLEISFEKTKKFP